MEDMIAKYVDLMDDEIETFYKYIDVIKCLPSSLVRDKLSLIAKDEQSHFKLLSDLLWENRKELTCLEQAFKDSVYEDYDDMKECLLELNNKN